MYLDDDNYLEHDNHLKYHKMVEKMKWIFEDEGNQILIEGYSNVLHWMKKNDNHLH